MKKSLIGYVEKETYLNWTFRDNHLPCFWFCKKPILNYNGLYLSKGYKKVKISIEEI